MHACTRMPHELWLTRAPIRIEFGIDECSESASCPVYFKDRPGDLGLEDLFLYHILLIGLRHKPMHKCGG